MRIAPNTYRLFATVLSRIICSYYFSEKKFSIRTNNIVPVDLNVFMAWNYDTLARFYDLFGKSR